MLKVGLTGGIGSGKSVIARVFESLGIPVFNSDIEAKKIMNSDIEVKQNLIALLGDEAYNESGLNRTYLRRQIFDNSEILEEVNAIVHPAVRKYFEQFCMRNHMKPYIIQEAAIIFERGIDQWLNIVITVFAPENIRINRTMTRDSISEEDVKKIIANQLPDEEKMERTDHLIHNYDPHLVLPQIIKIHQKLVSLNKD